MNDQIAQRRRGRPRKTQVQIKALPQIANSTQLCRPVQDVLNRIGAGGWLLLNVVTSGSNDKYSHAIFAETHGQNWEYKVIQFNMRDPLVGEKTLNLLCDDGWIPVVVFSQGGNHFATAAVLMRPLAIESIAGPELSAQAGDEASETSSDSPLSETENEGQVNVSKESLTAVT